MRLLTISLHSFIVLIYLLESESSNGADDFACLSRQDGESFIAADGCNRCSCRNGRASCTKMMCGSSGGTAEHRSNGNHKSVFMPLIIENYQDDVSSFSNKRNYEKEMKLNRNTKKATSVGKKKKNMNKEKEFKKTKKRKQNSKGKWKNYRRKKFLKKTSKRKRDQSIFETNKKKRKIAQRKSKTNEYKKKQTKFSRKKIKLDGRRKKKKQHKIIQNKNVIKHKQSTGSCTGATKDEIDEAKKNNTNLFKKASNGIRQISRFNSKKDTINKKKDKKAESFIPAFKAVKRAVGGDIKNIVCKKFSDGLTIKNISNDLDVLKNCQTKIEKTCNPVKYNNYTLDDGKEVDSTLCEEYFKNMVHGSCPGDGIDITTLVDRVKKCSNHSIKSSEQQVSKFKKCIKEVQACNAADRNVKYYIANCPEKNIIAKTVAIENDELVQQVNRFDSNTREVISFVPAHGDIGKTTYIMDADSGIMMTVSSRACYIRDIPDKVKPRDIETMSDEDLDNTEPVTDLMTDDDTTHTVVYNTGIASVEESKPLSLRMVQECANKPIYSTVEEKVSKDTFQGFKQTDFTYKYKLPSKGLPSRKRLKCRFGQGDLKSLCFINPEHQCIYVDDIKVHTDLHKLNILSFCLDCCNTMDDDPCRCELLYNIDGLLRFINNKQCYNEENCPQGFYHCGDGKGCRADILKNPTEKCPNGNCPPNRHLCGSKCWSDDFKDNLWSCGTDHSAECQEKKFPCGNPPQCPPQYSLCSTNRCVPTEDLNDYWPCDENYKGNCVPISRKCNGRCPEDKNKKSCGLVCIDKNSKRWTCGNKCQGPQLQCNGECNPDAKNRVKCGTTHCFTNNTNNPRTCIINGEPVCTHQDLPCPYPPLPDAIGPFIEMRERNGFSACSESRVLCNNTCIMKSDIWNSTGKCKCVLKTTMCDGECPPGYYNCTDRCKRNKEPCPKPIIYKDCNGYPILSDEQCDDTCRVGNISLKVGETLEYPEKCILLSCKLKYNGTNWKGAAFLESQTMGIISNDTITGQSCCSYEGKWTISDGKPKFEGATSSSSGCPLMMSTKSSRMRNFVKRHGKHGK